MTQQRSTVARASDGSSPDHRARPVASVARALLELLDVLSESEQDLGVNELAWLIGVSTITCPAQLAAEVIAVRERGYETVFGEREVDVNAIAAPVFERAGALAAIVGLQGPASRLEDPTKPLAPRLDGAAKLMRALGGAG